MKREIILIFTFAFFSCDRHEEAVQPIADVYSIPVVVHVLHHGEEIGDGPNISFERIQRQIDILNEDFRRKVGTRGYNDHRDGGDTNIEFLLAKQDPNGNKTSGIVRRKLVLGDLPDEVPDVEFEVYAYFSNWSPADYVNIWVAPYPAELANTILGKATGPDTDLPGGELFQKPLAGGAEGIIINWAHFGETDLEGGHHLGRTLTHEMGHYLGLLHTWGNRECETNDYCDDTPAVDDVVRNNEPYPGCNGESVMIANYMNYTPDIVMNIFTRDQIARMRHVLQNSPRRASLVSSPGAEEPN